MYIGKQKSVTASILIALLNNVPADSLITVNRVANLLIMDATGEESLGFIDLGGESVEMFSHNAPQGGGHAQP